MRRDPRGGQLLGDVPPASASLHRERDAAAAGEPRQPGPQVLPAGRGDLAAPDLPRHGVEIVEGDLLPVDIQPAYDRHRDLLTLPRAPMAPVREWLTNPIVTRLSWGGPRANSSARSHADGRAADACHLIARRRRISERAKHGFTRLGDRLGATDEGGQGSRLASWPASAHGSVEHVDRGSRADSGQPRRVARGAGAVNYHD